MKKAFFISDLHLGAAYHQDGKVLEKEVVAFLDKIKEEADSLFLMGDILDYWFEYKYAVPRGFVRFFGKLAELADNGVKVTWIIGNHDIWIFDYLPSELGIHVVDGMLECDVLGTPFLLQHGDAIGGNFKFRFLRGLFRNRFCQKLYSAIHPRWTVGFAINCSKSSRLKKLSPGYRQSSLIEGIRQWCLERIKQGDTARYFVFGHLHRKFDEKLEEGRRLIVIPDWPSSRSYGIFDGTQFEIKTDNI